MFKRIPPFIIALIAALIAAGSFIVIMGVLQNDNAPSVVLDEPGQYQEPGIATNKPVQGKPLQNATVRDLSDKIIATADYFAADTRPLLINFWFSTCQPCRREMPTLESAFLEYGDRIRFVGVNTQDSPEITQSFVEEIGVTYDLLRDPNSEFVVANGVAIFPTTLFVAADGTIVRQISGELSTQDLSTALDELISP